MPVLFSWLEGRQPGTQGGRGQSEGREQNRVPDVALVEVSHRSHGRYGGAEPSV